MCFVFNVGYRQSKSHVSINLLTYYNNIAHNATIDTLLTLLHVRSGISYIEGFDGSDIDDLIELV